jgi:subtilisin family serine protease
VLVALAPGCGRDSGQEAGTAGASSEVPGAGECVFTGTPVPKSGAENAPVVLLTDVRVGTHGCYERVVFEFRRQAGDPPGPLGYTVEYQPGPVTQDGSGDRVPVKGDAYLVVRLTATGHDLTNEKAPPTYTGPASLEPAGATSIRQVRRVGDFEGVLTWVVGLETAVPFTVTDEDSPLRLIVDVGTKPAT